MKDIFYTILVVWIVWRIYRSVTVYRSKQNPTTGSSNQRKPGETHIDHIPDPKRKMSDTEGEYVDYEEIK